MSRQGRPPLSPRETSGGAAELGAQQQNSRYSGYGAPPGGPYRGSEAFGGASFTIHQYSPRPPHRARSKERGLLLDDDQYKEAIQRMLDHQDNRLKCRSSVSTTNKGHNRQQNHCLRPTRGSTATPNHAGGSRRQKDRRQRPDWRSVNYPNPNPPLPLPLHGCSPSSTVSNSSARPATASLLPAVTSTGKTTGNEEGETLPTSPPAAKSSSDEGVEGRKQSPSREASGAADGTVVGAAGSSSGYDRDDDVVGAEDYTQSFVSDGYALAYHSARRVYGNEPAALAYRRQEYIPPSVIEAAVKQHKREEHRQRALMSSRRSSDGNKNLPANERLYNEHRQRLINREVTAKLIQLSGQGRSARRASSPRDNTNTVSSSGGGGDGPPDPAIEHDSGGDRRAHSARSGRGRGPPAGGETTAIRRQIRNFASFQEYLESTGSCTSTGPGDTYVSSA